MLIICCSTIQTPYLVQTNKMPSYKKPTSAAGRTAMGSLDTNAPVSRRTRANAKPMAEQKQLDKATYRGGLEYLGDESDTEDEASGQGHNNGVSYSTLESKHKVPRESSVTSLGPVPALENQSLADRLEVPSLGPATMLENQSLADRLEVPSLGPATMLENQSLADRLEVPSLGPASTLENSSSSGRVKVPIPSTVGLAATVLPAKRKARQDLNPGGKKQNNRSNVVLPGGMSAAQAHAANESSENPVSTVDPTCLPLPDGNETSYYLRDHRQLSNDSGLIEVVFSNPAQDGSIPPMGSSELVVVDTPSGQWQGWLWAGKYHPSVVSWIETLEKGPFAVARQFNIYHFRTCQRLQSFQPINQWKQQLQQQQVDKDEQVARELQVQFNAEAQSPADTILDRTVAEALDEALNGKDAGNEYEYDSEYECASNCSDYLMRKAYNLQAEFERQALPYHSDSEWPESEDDDDDKPDNEDARIACQLQNEEYAQAALDHSDHHECDSECDTDCEYQYDSESEWEDLDPFNSAELDDEEVLWIPGEELEDNDANETEEVNVLPILQERVTRSNDPAVVAARARTREFLIGFLQVNRDMCAEIPWKDFLDLDRNNRSMTCLSYRWIQRTDVQALTDFYMNECLSDDACMKLSKGRAMTLQDLIDIINDGSQELRKAVYTNTMRSSIQARIANGYVGSVPYSRKGAKSRIATHKANIMCTTANRPKSEHYTFARKDSVVSHFRIIATFPNDTHAFYPTNLEAILMGPWLNFYQRSRFNGFNPTATYEWVEELRRRHPLSNDLPSLGVHGTNRAWPLWQGFSEPESKEDSMCKNPNCSTMTVPAKKYSRVRADKLMPLGGGFVCNACYKYGQKYNGELRPAHLCDRPKARRKAVPGAKCLTPTCTNRYSNGVKFKGGYCHPCYNQVRRNEGRIKAGKSPVPVHGGRQTREMGEKKVVGTKCLTPQCTSIMTEKNKQQWVKGLCQNCRRRKENPTKTRPFQAKKVIGTKCLTPTCTNVITAKNIRRWCKGICRSCYRKQDEAKKRLERVPKIVRKVLGAKCLTPTCTAIMTAENSKNWSCGFCSRCANKNRKK
jgi:hypothetical protein